MISLTAGQVTAFDGLRLSSQIERAEGAAWFLLSNAVATDRRLQDNGIRGR